MQVLYTLSTIITYMDMVATNTYTLLFVFGFDDNRARTTIKERYCITHCLRVFYEVLLTFP
jgi:hypothetical protein